MFKIIEMVKYINIFLSVIVKIEGIDFIIYSGINVMVEKNNEFFFSSFIILLLSKFKYNGEIFKNNVNRLNSGNMNELK